MQLSLCRGLFNRSVILLFSLLFVRVGDVSAQETFRGMVQIFGNEEGAAHVNSRQWEPITKSLYTSLSEMFSTPPPDPALTGITREYYLVIRKADDITNCAAGASFRFWFEQLGKPGHEFTVPFDWGSVTAGTAHWIKVPNNKAQSDAIQTRDGIPYHWSNAYFRLEAKVPSTCSTPTIKIYSIFVAAFDVVGGTSAAITFNNDPVATHFPRYTTGGLGGSIISYNGNVGISHFTPQFKLDIASENLKNLRLSAPTAPLLKFSSQTYNYGDGAELWQSEQGDVYLNWNSMRSIFVAKENGDIGIGTTTPQSKLAVNGTITATKVKVTTTGWSDFVFKENYPLRSLTEVEAFIKTNQHLPDIPSEKEVVENGNDLGEMDKKLLQKIEELTLYLIDLKKENTAMKARLEKLEKE